MERKKGKRPFGYKMQDELLKDYIKHERTFLEKRDEDYPTSYVEQQVINPDFNAGLNIGKKLDRQLSLVDINRRRWQKSFITGNFVQEAFFQGKLGIDAYFVLFGLLGIFILPFLFYKRFKVHQ